MFALTLFVSGKWLFWCFYWCSFFGILYINEEASEKVLEVEQKYNEIRKPIYDKRNEKIKSILDLWLTAFLSHPALGELLNDEDQKIFKYISSLEVEDFKDLKSGYSITFNFDPNPYFEDANLTKTFTFLDEGTKITATKIKWKEGMGLPNGVDHEKKGNKRQFAEESFFTWFSDTQQKDDMDEIHDEVAEIIKEDLWPNPLTYFNNDADEEDFEDDEEVDKQGLPIGLQLIGRPWGEATVLRTLYQIQEDSASFYDISKAKSTRRDNPSSFDVRLVVRVSSVIRWTSSNRIDSPVASIGFPGTSFHAV
ncbi:NAP1-related protein 2-like [Hibiscus syriacus]|uniref:NAP1-related protein 2-like n=1 Tax=Hibiscus syriacus TaxID=106335 RepID=UPI001922D3DD|nr:NAP1-related protein 2-like [Hibiscus syriacus]